MGVIVLSPEIATCLSYGGRGESTDMQKIPYGPQALTQLLPF